MTKVIIKKILQKATRYKYREEESMEEIKKDLTELKEMVSKLLEIQSKEFNLKYGWMQNNN